jgi:hypothetical protein
VYFFDADGLTGKDLTEIDFLLAQTDAPAPGDHDGFIVEGIVDVRQAGVGMRSMPMPSRRHQTASLLKLNKACAEAKGTPSSLRMLAGRAL